MHYENTLILKNAGVPVVVLDFADNPEGNAGWADLDASHDCRLDDNTVVRFTNFDVINYADHSILVAAMAAITGDQATAERIVQSKGKNDFSVVTSGNASYRGIVWLPYMDAKKAKTNVYGHDFGVLQFILDGLHI